MVSPHQSDPTNAANDTMERRRAQRYLACFPVKLEPSVGVERLCVCRDMSVSGGMMMTQSRLPVGEPIEVALYLSDDVNAAHYTKARVVRVQRRTVRNSFWLYDAALAFDEPITEAEHDVRALAEKQERMGLYRRRK